MIPATFFPYLQRQHTFSYADINGAWRAPRFAESVSSPRVGEQAHLLINGVSASDGVSEDTPMGAALRELRREFGENRIQLKNGAELPLVRGGGSPNPACVHAAYRDSDNSRCGKPICLRSGNVAVEERLV